MHSQSVSPGAVICLLHADSCPSYRDTPFHTPIVSLSWRPCTLGSISSSAVSCILSSIIISYCITLARLLEPSDFLVAHPTWSLTSRMLVQSCSPRNPPTRPAVTVCVLAQGLAVALANVSICVAFSCEHTSPSPCSFQNSLDESFALMVSLPIISCSTSTSLLFSQVRNLFLNIFLKY